MSLASLKTAIPLLVVTIVVTIIGSLFPQPDLFRTWWYLGLLGLNGMSLLFITIVHTPMILERKGRNALIGVVVTLVFAKSTNVNYIHKIMYAWL